MIHPDFCFSHLFFFWHSTVSFFFLIKKRCFICSCVPACVSLSVCKHMCGTQSGQKRVLDSLDPVVSCHVNAGNQSQVLYKNSRTLDHWAITPAPMFPLLLMFPLTDYKKSLVLWAIIFSSLVCPWEPSSAEISEFYLKSGPYICKTVEAPDCVFVFLRWLIPSTGLSLLVL